MAEATADLRKSMKRGGRAIEVDWRCERPKGARTVDGQRAVRPVDARRERGSTEA